MYEPSSIGKLVLVIGIILVIIGLTMVFWGDRLSWIGNLPGDIRIERDNYKLYFPIATMILLSIIVNILFRLMKYLQ